MVIERRLALVVAGAVLTVSCGGAGSPAAPPATAAVKVESPVAESALTTVTLTAEAEARLGVQVAAVEERTVSRTRTIGGEVMAPPGAAAVVTAPFAGTLESPGGVPQVGTIVARGHAIFRLTPLIPSESAARVDADRAVGEALARQEVATRRLQRAELMLRDGAGSRRSVEEAQGEVAVAATDVKAARERLALAERGNATAAGITLEAPVTGLVRNVHASAGQMVAAGAPLFELVQLDTLWVRVPVYASDAAGFDLRAGARIVSLGGVGDAGTATADEGVPARMVAAPPTADATTATVDLHFAVAGGDFRPGQLVGVRLTRREAASSLLVPRAALLHDAYGGTWVYEARAPQVFVRHRVSVSDFSGPHAVLEEGPAPGTRVVTDGAAELFGTEFGARK